jgi:hypothetical protein
MEGLIDRVFSNSAVHPIFPVPVQIGPTRDQALKARSIFPNRHKGNGREALQAHRTIRSE